MSSMWKDSMMLIQSNEVGEHDHYLILSHVFIN